MDENEQAVKEAIAFAGADEKIRATDKGCWKENCAASIGRDAKHPGIVLVWLDRTIGTDASNCKLAAALIAFRDEECLEGKYRLRELTRIRLEDGLRHFRHVPNLASVAKDEDIAEDIRRSLEVK